jgi:hypothetical protein
MKIPLRLAIFRALQKADGPLTVGEIALSVDGDYRQVGARLAELATGKWPALQIQRVMPGVYQRVPD